MKYLSLILGLENKRKISLPDLSDVKRQEEIQVSALARIRMPKFDPQGSIITADYAVFGFRSYPDIRPDCASIVLHDDPSRKAVKIEEAREININSVLDYMPLEAPQA